MNFRICLACVVIAVLGTAGCGQPVTTDTTTGSNALTDQTRVAEVFSSSLTGYQSHDTLQLRITNDRLSVLGGGGTVPIVAGLKLTATATAGVFAGSRDLPSHVTETYTITVGTDGLVTNLQVADTSPASFTASVGALPAIAGASSKVWLAASTSQLHTQTASNTTSLTIDTAGVLWWDLDGDPATTDDVVMIALKADGADLVGSASVLYDWNGVAPLDLIVLSVRLTVSGSVITHVLASADPGALGTAETWVNSAPVTSSAVPRFGAWSASMAGHWLAIPTSGSSTISGSVPVIRQETERNAGGVVTTTLIDASGTETETVTIGYALDEKAGHPVVKMTVRTVAIRVGTLTSESTRYAIYFARGSDGVVYRIGDWEDANDDNIVDAGEESLYDATPAIAFPASEPADQAAYADTFTRWGTTGASNHLRNQTFASVSGYPAQSAHLSAATTTPAPPGFASVVGTGTSARLTSYWLPGTGIVGMRWAADSEVVRRFTRADSTYQQVDRTVTAVADLVLP